ncbi:MAG: hypothetical protein OHK0039_16570 [Bacteroidia bacterium]
MPDPIQPFIQITEPEPLAIIDAQADDIEVMVGAKSLGPALVRLHVHADECAFRHDDQLVKQIEYPFTCQSVFSKVVLKVPFTVVNTRPSSSAVLIRFTAVAVNSQGGISMETPFFNVDLRPNKESVLSLILPSEDVAVTPLQPDQPDEDPHA